RSQVLSKALRPLVAVRGIGSLLPERLKKRVLVERRRKDGHENDRGERASRCRDLPAGGVLSQEVGVSRHPSGEKRDADAELEKLIDVEEFEKDVPPQKGSQNRSDRIQSVK